MGHVQLPAVIVDPLLMLSDSQFTSTHGSDTRCVVRAEKEKQQLKIEVEQSKEQMENVSKAKVRNFEQSRM